MQILRECFKAIFMTKGGWFFMFLVLVSIADYTKEFGVFESALLGSIVGVIIYNWDEAWHKKLPRSSRFIG